MTEIRIGLLGAGTVGRGLIEILSQEADHMEARFGLRPRVVRVADRSFQKKPILAPFRPTASVMEVVEDPDVDVVVELMGGLDPAGPAILAALRSGRSVVTANKALIAGRQEELFAALHEGQERNPNASLGFEAAVGGALPLVRNMRLLWAAGGVEGMVGILNGTCNFIITRMQEDGMEYAGALRLAQEKGFAEADPTFDVSGRDAAQKLAILSMLAFDCTVPESAIHVEGIDRFDRVDLEMARKMGRVIRLLAIARREGSRVLLRVHPAMIPASHLLADVRDEFNALFLRDRYAGPSLIVGRGAGALPTAAAVLSDVMAIATGSRDRWVGALKPVDGVDDAECRFYFRFRTQDRPGVLASVAGVLAEHGISIATMHQEEGPEPVNVVIVTHEARESAVHAAIRVIDGSAPVLAPTVVVRLEDNPDASL